MITIEEIHTNRYLDIFYAGVRNGNTFKRIAVSAIGRGSETSTCVELGISACKNLVEEWLYTHDFEIECRWFADTDNGIFIFTSRYDAFAFYLAMWND